MYQSTYFPTDEGSCRLSMLMAAASEPEIVTTELTRTPSYTNTKADAQVSGVPIVSALRRPSVRPIVTPTATTAAIPSVSLDPAIASTTSNKKERKSVVKFDVSSPLRQQSMAPSPSQTIASGGPASSKPTVSPQQQQQQRQPKIHSTMPVVTPRKANTTNGGGPSGGGANSSGPQAVASSYTAGGPRASMSSVVAYAEHGLSVGRSSIPGLPVPLTAQLQSTSGAGGEQQQNSVTTASSSSQVGITKALNQSAIPIVLVSIAETIHLRSVYEACSEGGDKGFHGNHGTDGSDGTTMLASNGTNAEFHAPNAAAALAAAAGIVQAQGPTTHRPLTLDTYHVSMLLHRARVCTVPPMAEIQQIIAEVKRCHMGEGDRGFSMGPAMATNMTRTRREMRWMEEEDIPTVFTGSSTKTGKTTSTSDRRSTLTTPLPQQYATAPTNLTFEMLLQIVELAKQWGLATAASADFCDSAFKDLAANHEAIVSEGGAFGGNRESSFSIAAGPGLGDEAGDGMAISEKRDDVDNARNFGRPSIVVLNQADVMTPSRGDASVDKSGGSVVSPASANSPGLPTEQTLSTSSKAEASAESKAQKELREHKRLRTSDLERALSAMGLEYDFSTLFSGVDPNYDGETITSRMFRWAAGKEDPDIVRRFAAMGGEETLSGTITADTLIAKCAEINLPQEFIKNFIAEVDANGDGVVDYGEFLSMLLRNRHETIGKKQALNRTWSMPRKKLAAQLRKKRISSMSVSDSLLGTSVEGQLETIEGGGASSYAHRRNTSVNGETLGNLYQMKILRGDDDASGSDSSEDEAAKEAAAATALAKQKAEAAAKEKEEAEGLQKEKEQRKKERRAARRKLRNSTKSENPNHSRSKNTDAEEDEDDEDSDGNNSPGSTMMLPPSRRRRSTAIGLTDGTIVASPLSANATTNNAFASSKDYEFNDHAEATNTEAEAAMLDDAVNAVVNSMGTIGGGYWDEDGLLNHSEGSGYSDDDDGRNNLEDTDDEDDDSERTKSSDDELTVMKAEDQRKQFGYDFEALTEDIKHKWRSARGKRHHHQQQQQHQAAFLSSTSGGGIASSISNHFISAPSSAPNSSFPLSSDTKGLSANNIGSFQISITPASRKATAALLFGQGGASAGTSTSNPPLPLNGDNFISPPNSGMSDRRQSSLGAPGHIMLGSMSRQGSAYLFSTVNTLSGEDMNGDLDPIEADRAALLMRHNTAQKHHLSMSRTPTAGSIPLLSGTSATLSSTQGGNNVFGSFLNATSGSLASAGSMARMSMANLLEGTDRSAGESEGAGTGMGTARFHRSPSTTGAPPSTIAEAVISHTDRACAKAAEQIAAHRAKVDAVLAKHMGATPSAGGGMSIKSGGKRNVILTDDGPFSVTDTSKAVRERTNLKLIRQRNLRAPPTSPRLFALNKTTITKLEHQVTEQEALLREEVGSYAHGAEATAERTLHQKEDMERHAAILMVIAAAALGAGALNVSPDSATVGQAAKIAKAKAATTANTNKGVIRPVARKFSASSETSDPGDVSPSVVAATSQGNDFRSAAHSYTAAHAHQLQHRTRLPVVDGDDEAGENEEAALDPSRPRVAAGPQRSWSRERSRGDSEVAGLTARHVPVTLTAAALNSNNTTTQQGHQPRPSSAGGMFSSRAHVSAPSNGAAFAEAPRVPNSHTASHTAILSQRPLSASARKQARPEGTVPMEGAMMSGERPVRVSPSRASTSRPASAGPSSGNRARGSVAAPPLAQSTHTYTDGPFGAQPPSTGATSNAAPHAFGPAFSCSPHRRHSHTISASNKAATEATRRALSRIVQSHLSFKLPAADAAFLKASGAIDRALQEVQRIYTPGGSTAAGAGMGQSVKSSRDDCASSENRDDALKGAAGDYEATAYANTPRAQTPLQWSVPLPGKAEHTSQQQHAQASSPRGRPASAKTTSTTTQLRPTAPAPRPPSAPTARRPLSASLRAAGNQQGSGSGSFRPTQPTRPTGTSPPKKVPEFKETESKENGARVQLGSTKTTVDQTQKVEWKTEEVPVASKTIVAPTSSAVHTAVPTAIPSPPPAPLSRPTTATTRDRKTAGSDELPPPAPVVGSSSANGSTTSSRRDESGSDSFKSTPPQLGTSASVPQPKASAATKPAPPPAVTIKVEPDYDDDFENDYYGTIREDEDEADGDDTLAHFGEAAKQPSARPTAAASTTTSATASPKSVVPGTLVGTSTSNPKLLTVGDADDLAPIGGATRPMSSSGHRRSSNSISFPDLPPQAPRDKDKQQGNTVQDHPFTPTPSSSAGSRPLRPQSANRSRPTSATTSPKLF